jgi:sugar diacid utilization regulator
VFSQRKYKNKELHREIMRIKNLLNSLLFLKGLYSMDELSLLYLLTNAPREQKVLLYSADQLKIKDEVIIFLNTLRLYLVLRSIKEVSQLLGIHVNSVKYRIEKAVQYMEMGSDLSLNEISSLGTLLYLERMTAERR